MRQTRTDPKPATRLVPRRPDMTLKEALIVLGVTTALSIAIGLLPHFG
jgi:hypothetical protein